MSDDNKSIGSQSGGNNSGGTTQNDGVKGSVPEKNTIPSRPQKPSTSENK